jgi:hypothetical protein
MRLPRGKPPMSLSLGQSSPNAMWSLIARKPRWTHAVVARHEAPPPNSTFKGAVRRSNCGALNRIGRIAEALQIVDLDRHVARVAFEPPAQFGAIDQFNRHLADDILADRALAKPASEGFDYNPAP